MRIENSEGMRGFTIVIAGLVLGGLFIIVFMVNQTIKEENQIIAEREQAVKDYHQNVDCLVERAKEHFENKRYDSIGPYLFILAQYHGGSESERTVQELQDRAAEIREAAKLAREQERKRTLGLLRKDYDDISGVTWYKQPYFTHYDNSNLMSAYIGVRDSGSKWMRLKMSYYGDGWIFFNRAFLSFEGNTMEVLFSDYNDKKTEVGNGGKVWEWIDISASKTQIEFLKNLAESKDAKMRLSGKYSKTRDLTYNERRGLQLIVKAYEML